jgi:hypothetical protein
VKTGKSKTDAYTNVKGQIGYCGIWCGSCVVGNGVLKKLTKDYEKIVRDHGLKEWGPRDFNFDEFMKGLTSIQNMELCRGCLKGGGRDNCEMRKCVQDRKLADCSECGVIESCRNKELLEYMRSGAEGAGLFVKRRKGKRAILLKKWRRKLKNTWPCYILFR